MLESAECDVGWSTSEGAQGKCRLLEGQLCLIGSKTQHSARWLKPAHLLMLHLEPILFQEIGGAPFDNVSVHDVASIARDDLVIWEILSAFRRMVRSGKTNHPLYLESLATVLLLTSSALIPSIKSLAPGEGA